jgi:hypothetical protein
MVEYTCHAWQEDDACYNAALQICKDYEEDMLWCSEADQKRWRAYARSMTWIPIPMCEEEDGALVAETFIKGSQAIVSQPCFEDGNKTCSRR